MKPLIPETVRVVEVELPWVIVSNEGFAKRMKSPPLTWTYTVMFSMVPPLVAVIPTG